jgi:hypothetical protein
VNQPLHHIRLVAAFEIQPGTPGARSLTLADCEQLATALAADLARTESSVDKAMLVVGGSLLEPSALLSPGFLPWAALADLAQPAIREHGSNGRILAIGTHDGQLPDARLRADKQPPGGKFLAVPLLLVVPEGASASLRARLEEKLFETSGISPPARAVLAESTGFDTIHGQLMTLADLVALQHIQMDTAGMGAFWPVVEHVLVSGDEAVKFSLPARLEASWDPGPAIVMIRFFSFDQYADSPGEYALWVRAFRSLSALLDSHGIAWRADSSLEYDARHECLVERAGPVAKPDSLTEQKQPECGLIAWTLIENGYQVNLYPLSSLALGLLKKDLDARAIALTDNVGGICYDETSLELRAAP